MGWNVIKGGWGEARCAELRLTDLPDPKRLLTVTCCFIDNSINRPFFVFKNV